MANHQLIRNLLNPRYDAGGIILPREISDTGAGLKLLLEQPSR